MRFVVLETEEGNGAHIDCFALAGGCADVQHGIEVARFGNFEAIAIFIVLARDVSCERVPSVRPPEAGAVILVERQSLFRQTLPAIGLHREIPIQHVVLLRGVLEEKPVADRLVADAIAHEQIIRAVNGDPAIA